MKKTPLIISKASSGLSGRVAIPGDKSISHRALMFAALAEGISNITGLLEGEDVLRTARAVAALGAVIERIGENWRVEGCGSHGVKEPADVLDMGNSGTAARLLSGILASHPIVSVMTGDESLRKRPMGRVTVPLSGIGASFVAREGKRLPMAIVGVGDGKALCYRLPVASAQVKSAVLLAGLNCEGETIIEEPVATRDHTENMLRYFGVDVRVEEIKNGGRKIRMQGPAKLVGRDVIVPGDPSSAAFPLVAALLVPHSQIIIENIGLNPLRTGLITTLQEMGASLTIVNKRLSGGESVGDICVKSSSLHGVIVPPERAPSMIDEYPILAVACACARGQTRLCGLSELRVKESDRFASTVAMLQANGIEVEIDGDDLIIHGQEYIPGGGKVETNMDHRLAMSGVVLGLIAEASVAIDDISFIDTSFPGFIGLMDSLGANLLKPLKKMIIAVDGPAAAGKGTLAKALAARLKIPYLDTGLLYRAVTRRALDEGVDLNCPEALSHQARILRPSDLERQDLRTPEIDGVVSLVARHGVVRDVLLEWQRHFAKEEGGVLDGRDIGTVVFPDADAKFFITASARVRAQRRYQQRYGHLCQDEACFAKEVEELTQRDQVDSSRDVSPLIAAHDAVEIMTDNLSISDVMNKVVKILYERGLLG